MWWLKFKPFKCAQVTRWVPMGTFCKSPLGPEGTNFLPMFPGCRGLGDGQPWLICSPVGVYVLFDMFPSGFNLLVPWTGSAVLLYNICQPCANVPGVMGHDIVAYTSRHWVGQLSWATSVPWVLKTTIFKHWWWGLDFSFSSYFILSNANKKK